MPRVEWSELSDVVSERVHAARAWLEDDEDSFEGIHASGHGWRTGKVCLRVYMQQGMVGGLGQFGLRRTFDSWGFAFGCFLVLLIF